jgi:outer membrane protein assembly factor BamB
VTGATRFRLLGVVGAVIMTLALARTIAGDTGSTASWPALQNDTRRTGRTTVAGPTDNAIRWTFPAPGAGISSSPAIGPDGTIFFGGWDRKLYAVNRNGFLDWTFTADTAGSRISSSPAIGPDGTVYFGSWDIYLYAVNPDGTKRWRSSTGGYVTSSPVVSSDGTVYVGSWDGRLYAFNANNGGLKWSFAANLAAAQPQITSSPALAPDQSTVYFGSWDRNAYAVRTSNGSEKWHFTTASYISGTPAVGDDGTVYIGSWDGKLYALNASNGTMAWSYTTNGSVRSSPALASDGTIYVGSSWDQSSKEALYAIEPPAGGSTSATLLWKKTFGSSTDWVGDATVSLPVVDSGERVYVGGALYLTTSGPTLFAFDSDGSDAWGSPGETGGKVDSTPAIGSDGTLYVGAWDDTLYAFGPALSACSNRDFDADGQITAADLVHLAARYAMRSSDADWNPRYDLFADGQIDAKDTGSLATAWWATSCSS